MTQHFCGNCGAEVQDNNNFCAQCGSPAERKTAEHAEAPPCSCSCSSGTPPGWLWGILLLILAGGIMLTLKMMPEKKEKDKPLTQAQIGEIVNDIQPDSLGTGTSTDSSAEVSLNRINSNEPLLGKK
jgi:MYXO-CTERM domain-containing protein